jgi:hypothetical protein
MLALTTFAKVIGPFLVIYISGASATPTPHFSPRNSLLIPRVPAQNGCGGAEWLRRECLMERVLQTWRDVCQTALPNGSTITSEVYSSCPKNTVCTSTFDADDGRPTIQCEPVFTPGKKQDPIPGTKLPQIGTTNVVKVGIQASRQFGFPVTIESDMHASVTAFVLSRFLLPITRHQPC